MDSSSRSRVGFHKSCDFVILIQQVLWLRGQDADWDTSSLVAWLFRFRKFCIFLVKIPVGMPQILGLRGQDRSRPRLGYVKFFGFVVKMPVGIPQVSPLRGQDPG